MELDQDWEPGIPLLPGSFGQDDKQQLLWGFPEILWETVVITTFPPGGRIAAATIYVAGCRAAHVYTPGTAAAQTAT